MPESAEELCLGVGREAHGQGEKDGEHVAQFKFTVLLMPNGPHKITGLPLDLDIVESEKSIEDLDIQVSGACYRAVLCMS